MREISLWNRKPCIQSYIYVHIIIHCLVFSCSQAVAHSQYSHPSNHSLVGANRRPCCHGSTAMIRCWKWLFQLERGGSMNNHNAINIVWQKHVEAKRQQIAEHETEPAYMRKVVSIHVDGANRRGARCSWQNSLRTAFISIKFDMITGKSITTKQQCCPRQLQNNKDNTVETTASGKRCYYFIPHTTYICIVCATPWTVTKKAKRVSQRILVRINQNHYIALQPFWFGSFRFKYNTKNRSVNRVWCHRLSSKMEHNMNFDEKILAFISRKTYKIAPKIV